MGFESMAFAIPDECSVLPTEPTSQPGASHYICFPINQGIDESRTVNI